MNLDPPAKNTRKAHADAKANEEVYSAITSEKNSGIVNTMADRDTVGVEANVTPNAPSTSDGSKGQAAQNSAVIQIDIDVERKRREKMELTKSFMEEGKFLGLSGSELKDFVLSERERHAQIEKEEREREREERLVLLQAEREREERNFQLEQLRIQSAAQQNANNSANANHGSSSDFKPKIPFLDDKDDVESWFHQYEHYTRDCKLDDETKASRIVYFLKGKARVVYSKLSDEDATDYETIKATLFESFQLTSEDYRKKFRSSKKVSSETYKEFIAKSERYLNKWVELSGCDDCVDNLKDLLLREQVLESLSPELAIHVRDRNPASAKEIGEIATTYQQARSATRPGNAEQAHGGRRNNVPQHRNRPNRENTGNNTRSERPEQNNSSSNSSQNSYKQKTHMSEEERIALKKTGACYFCKVKGHMFESCPKRNKSKEDTNGNVNVGHGSFESVGPLEMLCGECEKKHFSETVAVKIDGKVVKAIRDSGCNRTMISSKIISKDKIIPTEVRQARLAEKDTVRQYPAARVHIDCPYFIGEDEVSVMDDPVHPVLIGKWFGIGENRKRTPVYPTRTPEWYSDVIANVTTRSQQKDDDAKASCSTTPDITKIKPLHSAEDLKREQATDPSLTYARNCAEKGKGKKDFKFTYKDGILLRCEKARYGSVNKQVVVPAKMRNEVLQFGHDHPMSGHLGQRKTIDRIRAEFWWPGVGGDIKRYCLSCDACQRSTPKGYTKKVPLGQMPPISTVFKRVAVDIIGPIKPMSENKNQYVLVAIDYATRYPEAVALRDIRANTVAEALWEMWTRLGIPDEVITDQGSQFSGKLMEDVNNFLQIKHRVSTPFHPQSNGLVERFNFCLKSMMKRMSQEQPKKWDTFIPALLFAYREVPQASLGFSPFELLYGRAVKGPMQILRHAWTKDEVPEELKTTAEYVVDLRNRIEETCQIAKENLQKAARVQAKHFNKKTADRKLEVGKKVLLLKPAKHNKLELLWQGPYTVVEKLSRFDYRIRMGNKTKVYHINLMKEYNVRDSPAPKKDDATTNTTRRIVDVAQPSTSAAIDTSNADEEDDVEEDLVAVVMEEDCTMNDDIFQHDMQKMLPLLETKRTEFSADVHFAEQLSQDKMTEVKQLVDEFSDNLTDVPKTTNLLTCNIQVSDPKPVYIKPRPIPHAMVGTVEDEISEMLKLGVIEQANSPYNSPIVLIKKKDGKFRFCADMRGANKVVVFDAEPITDVDHLFQSLGKAKFFSKLDLTKGYWAIPIDEKDRNITAFTTSAGQFRWVNLPFGLKTASGIFNRMMRLLLNPIKSKDVHHFMDDILIASETWEEHMAALRAVLTRMKEANVAAKPSKCYIGYDELPYLGHEIGHGERWPDSEKVVKIQEAVPPRTKKEMRSFLGLTNFYRTYIEDYSTIAAPLTDMTKKNHPEKLAWSEKAKESFAKLKDKISQKPVLCMPDHNKTFVLRTDASDKGLGAVLMQEHDGMLRPIAYQSKKLNGAESRYATVEKECLATVWGVGKFERYLYGKHFVIETDHQPLKHLQSHSTNPRLTRWALQLQPYSFTVKVIPGKDNHGADYLSRASY